MPTGGVDPRADIDPGCIVEEIRSVPESGQARYRIDHLPPDVERFFQDAIRVMDAGVLDAAAVQLRRALKVAAAHKNLTKRTFVQSVQAMIEQGLATKDFGEVLTHVRKIGNIGAHYSDERLSEAEVERAMRFTTQFLRNVFEVPGELHQLAQVEGEPPVEEQAAEATGLPRSGSFIGTSDAELSATLYVFGWTGSDDSCLTL